MIIDPQDGRAANYAGIKTLNVNLTGATHPYNVLLCDGSRTIQCVRTSTVAQFINLPDLVYTIIVVRAGVQPIALHVRPA
jgi:hypothetical protein